MWVVHVIQVLCLARLALGNSVVCGTKILVECVKCVCLWLGVV